MKIYWVIAAAAAFILGFAGRRFYRETTREIKELLTYEPAPREWIVTEEQTKKLPPPVQRWLRQSGMTGRLNIHTAALKQEGLMRLKPEQVKSFPAEAEQFITTDYPSFIWRVKMKMQPGFAVTGRDWYRFGQGEMLIKAASVFPLVTVRHNKKANQSTLQRYLMEMAWYPSAALSPFVSWEAVDDRTAKAVMSYCGCTGEGIFHFSEEGELIRLSAYRFRDKEDEEPTEWQAEALEYMTVDGIRMPARVSVSWVLPEGKFTWYTFSVKDVRLNERRTELIKEMKSR
ncbi:DUF6920 family protein [Alkalicoccus saliphilus]|uniref:Uncharacterized protein n=1 Tax=Alkalicoccus saliphilus TaxID=200989 RepID=A0A2T4U5T4_9BACI|nr:DUF6544 family protein [Alkalicoccus saliphilus]PTL38767.1 hypothetical protein C6Y45_09755 [Alkalicoccus saliphilus]